MAGIGPHVHTQNIIHIIAIDSQSSGPSRDNEGFKDLMLVTLVSFY